MMSDYLHFFICRSFYLPLACYTDHETETKTFIHIHTKQTDYKAFYKGYSSTTGTHTTIFQSIFLKN